MNDHPYPIIRSCSSYALLKATAENDAEDDDEEAIDCDNCTMRKIYAKRFDEHWFGKDDCPLNCELAQHVQGLDGLLNLIRKERNP